MGLNNSPDIFQENMSNLFRDLEYVREYIDNLLITSNGSLQDHLEKVEKSFKDYRRQDSKLTLRSHPSAEQKSNT